MKLKIINESIASKNENFRPKQNTGLIFTEGSNLNLHGGLLDNNGNFYSNNLIGGNEAIYFNFIYFVRNI